MIQPLVRQLCWQVTIPPLVSVSNRKQLAKWLWIPVGILQANSIALSQIATYWPGAARAESRVSTIRRWLMNFRVDVWSFYRPLLEHALQGWHAVPAMGILDGVTVFHDRWQLFRWSLAQGRRAIPLAGRGLPTEGLTHAEKLAPLLQRAAAFLNPRVRQLTLLADRGFRDCEWAERGEQLNWNYGIRLANRTCRGLADGQWLRLDHRDVSPTPCRVFQKVLVARSVQWPANLTVTRRGCHAQAESEIVAVLSNRPAGRSRLREDAQRMDSDETLRVRDDKSGGFDMEHTRWPHPERWERLLLALALATLWCHELGEHVWQGGEAARRELDPGATRELSLFQLGLRRLKRGLANALALLPQFVARLSPVKLKPVMHRAIVKV